MSDPWADLRAYFEHLAESAEASSLARRPRTSQRSSSFRRPRAKRLAGTLAAVIGLLVVVTAGILLTSGDDQEPRIATTGPAASPALPDEIVAVTTDRRLVVMSSVDGHVVRVLADDALAEGKDADGSTSLSATPDGGNVYFIREPSECTGCASIAVVPIAGGPITNALGAGCCIRSPAVSPDGRWLAFTGVPNRSDAGRAILLRALNVPSSTEGKQWTSEAALNVGIVNLAWAPDSRHLAFVQADAADCKCQRLLDIDASESTLLDHAPRIEIQGADGMSWSGYLGETGQMLAVSDIGDRPGESLSGSGKPLRVVAIDPDTGKVVRTLFELDLANQPVADRSGTHILVKSANALYRWSEGNDEAIKVADNILAAQWVPAAAQEVSTTTTSNESDAAVAFRSPPKATWGGVIEFREDGSIRADGFNEYIVAAQPSWKSDPRAAALALFDISEGPTPTTLEPTGIPTVEVADNSDGAITVSITTEVPGDDSVSGSRQTATLTRADDGTLRLVRGTWAQRCIRGDSPEAFVAAICP